MTVPVAAEPLAPREPVRPAPRQPLLVERREPVEISSRTRWPPLRRCPATLAMSVFLAVVFALEWATGALFLFRWRTLIDPLELLALGANSAVLVKAGEWHRLVTGNLLHGGWLHFVLNLAALLYLGAVFERLLGARRYLTLLLLSCLGGSLASAYLTDAMSSVGVSTGLLGLIGANLVYAWRFAEDRRRMLRSQGLLLVLIVAFSLPLEWLLGIRADHFGHLGGLVTGVLYALVATPQRSVAGLRHARGGVVATATSAALVLLFLGTAARTAYVYAARGLVPTAESFLAHIEMAEDPDEAAFLKFFFNNAAWTLAIRADATREQLEVARAGMRWVTEEDPRATVAERDTLATILHRLGDHGAAVRLERQVLELARDPEIVEAYGFGEGDVAFFASQLARFEWARYRARGPLTSPGLELPQAVLVRGAEPACPAAGPPPPLSVGQGLAIGKGSWDVGVEVDVVLVRDGSPVAFLELDAAPGTPAWLAYADLDRELLACAVRPVVTLARTAAASDRGAGARWWLWKISTEAARLPE